MTYAPRRPHFFTGTPHLTEAVNLVSRERLKSVFSIAVLSMATIFVFWLPFLNAGYGFDALFDVASAVSTTGFSTGVVGPLLEPHLKLAVTGAMLLGRVEFVALLVLIWPPTWFKLRLRLLQSILSARKRRFSGRRFLRLRRRESVAGLTAPFRGVAAARRRVLAIAPARRLFSTISGRPTRCSVSNRV
jgi:hypothetical protein